MSLITDIKNNCINFTAINKIDDKHSFNQILRKRKLNLRNTACSFATEKKVFGSDLISNARITTECEIQYRLYEIVSQTIANSGTNNKEVA